MQHEGYKKTALFLSVTDWYPAVLWHDRFRSWYLGRDRTRRARGKEWRQCGKHMLLQVLAQIWQVTLYRTEICLKCGILHPKTIHSPYLLTILSLRTSFHVFLYLFTFQGFLPRLVRLARGVSTHPVRHLACGQPGPLAVWTHHMSQPEWTQVSVCCLLLFTDIL